jgi:hypothetical protein
MTPEQTSQLAFLDTETRGLYFELGHEPYEIAYIVDGEEIVHWVKPDLSKADPMALKIGRFHERTAVLPRVSVSEGTPGWIPAEYAAEQIARDLDGRHLVGAVPSFDDLMLRVFLRRNGQAPTWHYHLIDVETLAVGALAERRQAVTLPWRSDDVSRALGVEPPADDERHTALGDARWARRLYEAVCG